MARKGARKGERRSKLMFRVCFYGYFVFICVAKTCAICCFDFNVQKSKFIMARIDAAVAVKKAFY